MADDPEIRGWVDRLTDITASIGDFRQRAFLFADSVMKLEPGAAAAALDRTIDLCFTMRERRFKLTADAAMIAMLLDLWPKDHRSATAEAAAKLQAGLAEIYAKWVDASAPPDDGSGPKAPDYGRGRPLTLGERRALAVKPSRRLLERAVADPHPMVVKKLLNNPRLTEDDVVRMSARRPAMPAALVEIAVHPRWRSRQRPALALAQNPALPAGVGLTLLPGLNMGDVAEIRSDMHLHPLIRKAASQLIQRAEPPEETKS